MLRHLTRLAFALIVVLHGSPVLALSIDLKSGILDSIVFNPDGSVTVQATSGFGNVYGVVLPPGTDAPGGTLSVTLDPFGYGPNEPGIFIANATLLSGSFKSITMAIGAGTSVCIDDSASPNFVELNAGFCRSEILIPTTLGGFATDGAGHQVMLLTGSTVRIDGLRNSLVQSWQDTDFDGFRDAQDATPVPEPASVLLTGIGLAAVHALRRRRRTSRT